MASDTSPSLVFKLWKFHLQDLPREFGRDNLRGPSWQINRIGMIFYAK